MKENSMTGTIIAVSISKNKGEKKKNVDVGKLKLNFGLEGDAHAGSWHRQVSLLSLESIEKMKSKGADVYPGDFAENITTEGILLNELPIGSKLKLGKKAIVEVTQIGKKCHQRCDIYYSVGNCVMPKEGIFVKVLEEGDIHPKDVIVIL